MRVSLNGVWEAGELRDYTLNVPVPGLATDPARMNDGALWYRRSVPLPAGDWTHATLELGGARFCPTVYVNGERVSHQPGGMTITTHPLQSDAVKPGNTILLEVELQSLKDVDEFDASRIPPADHWRTNISSCLWDHVTLHLHGPTYFRRVIPVPQLNDRQVLVRWQLEHRLGAAQDHILDLEVTDTSGRLLACVSTPIAGDAGATAIPFWPGIAYWTPETPVCYRLSATLRARDGRRYDWFECALGIKEFCTEGHGFLLNGEPVRLRAGTVVWHRWVRDEEARSLAFDTDWFEEKIARRLLERGANTLRYHLGTPPEAFLSLCDRLGLLVQAEWSFFHGMDASYESLLEQWRNWLDVCARHPSVSLIHAWNETEGERLAIAFSALNALEPDYPRWAIGHRDVIHVHKYWWSLFENVGLYYDSATQFSKPIMADEFGGNYLDGEGNPGGYPTVRESFLRFLGPNHDAALRLQLHTESNASIAEYWRRLGAAGFSPFCIAGSYEDGSHHFLGPLQEGKPKPVWDALTAAYSPLSASLEVWDRNYEPGQTVTVPVHLINDTAEAAELHAVIGAQAADAADMVVSTPLTVTVKPHHSEQVSAQLTLPAETGNWSLRAVLTNPPENVTRPVVSQWRIRTMEVQVPARLQQARIALAENEFELREFLSAHELVLCALDDPDANLLVGSKATWEKLQSRHAPDLLPLLERQMLRGASLVLLDVGPTHLGQGYLPVGELGPLQGRPVVRVPNTVSVKLVGNIQAHFKEVAEPESCVHPSEQGLVLWRGMDQQATWLWNGLRGGLVAPADDMEVSGLSQEAFLAQWTARGADPDLVQSDSYYAYELAGFCAFSTQPNDKVTIEQLRRKVRHLFEDAPALQHVIDPNAKVKMIDLAAGYRAESHGSATTLTPLVLCGKNLTRTPVVEIGFSNGGKLLLSQLITAGRLANDYGTPGLYGLRTDPAARQFALNLMAHTLR